MQFDASYRKDKRYPNPLQSGFYRGYGNPDAPNLPATRDWHQIKAILVHTTNGNGTAYKPEAEFLRDSPKVSTHYVVSSHDQTVIELLPPGFIAWHAGDCLDNDYENIKSIGIEIAWTPSAGALPQLAIDNVTRLVRQLLEWYPWIRKIDMHRTQAVPMGRKVDPSGWPNAAFYAWREAILHGAASTIVVGTDQGATQPAHALLTEDTPIMSAPRGTATQCIRYVLSRPHTNYADNDVDLIVRTYVAQCVHVGADPLVAIAQMIHETGNLCSFWSARPQRNPAGIGVSGDATLSSAIAKQRGWTFNPSRNVYEAGCSFASWVDDAIPAHVGRLLTYAINPLAGTEAQKGLSIKALEYRSLPSKLWGSAPAIKQLGKAHNPAGEGWASPGLDYGTRIAAIMNAIRGL